MTHLQPFVYRPLPRRCPGSVQSLSSAGEHFPDTEGVGGSNPPATIESLPTPVGFFIGACFGTPLEFPMANSKFKTKKAAAKRFKVSGSGKIVRAHANKRHILTKKSSKRKRNLCGTALMRDCDAQLVAPLIPYKF